jgi:hypothetical protein
LVLDNADNPTVDYQDYFPDGKQGVVLLTSRNDECQQYATVKSIILEGLPKEEAQELLLKAARVPQDQYSVHAEDALKVASLLQSHPLALIHAGEYVSRGHCTLAEYPRIFAQQRQRLLAFKPAQAQSRYQDVYLTFEASAAILRSSSTEFTRDALADERPTFVDSAYGTLSQGQSSEMKVIVPEETVSTVEEFDDSSTEYSDVSMADSQIDTYMDRLADDLYAVTITLQSDSQLIRALCENLPEMLQQFALRISYEVPSREGREIMYYVHQHRRSVQWIKFQELFPRLLPFPVP